MRLDISAEAKADLREMFLYGRDRYGETAALAYLQSTLLAIDRIAEWPLASRLRREVQPPIRLVPHLAHNIFYDAAADRVSVVRVLHHSVDWENLL